jgi:ubiquinol-cytochrome c reductase cytochrome c subunit
MSSASRADAEVGARVKGIVCSIMVVAFAGGAAAQDTPQGNVANGKALYASTGCYQCHGFAGQGGAAGPKLNPPTPWEPWLLQLRTPRFVMPPYAAGVLSDQQAADIYAYVRTFPVPPDPSTIRILQ